MELQLRPMTKPEIRDRIKECKCGKKSIGELHFVAMRYGGEHHVSLCPQHAAWAFNNHRLSIDVIQFNHWLDVSWITTEPKPDRFNPMRHL